MSLEANIAALTEAVVALTDITTKLHSLRADAIEQVTAAAKPGAAKKAAATKADEPAAEPKAEPKAEAKAEAKADAPAANEPTPEFLKMKKSVADFLGGSEREEEREARKAKVRELLANPKVAATKLEDVKPELYPAIESAMTRLIAAGDLTKPAGAEDPLDLGV